MAVVARYCSVCWRFLDDEGHGTDVIEWVDCGKCAGRGADATISRPRLAQPNGQGFPAVCLQCGEPFVAARRLQKFCCNECRVASMRIADSRNGA
jgi:hypothetical protein